MASQGNESAPIIDEGETYWSRSWISSMRVEMSVPSFINETNSSALSLSLDGYIAHVKMRLDGIGNSCALHQCDGSMRLECLSFSIDSFIPNDGERPHTSKRTRTRDTMMKE